MSNDLAKDAVRKMLDLSSVRIQCTSTREGEMEDHPGTMKLTLTVAGEDCHRQGDLERSELIDHVRAILGEPREGLLYRGTEYVRDPRSGEWLSENVDRNRRGHVVVIQDRFTFGSEAEDPTWNESDWLRRYLLFGNALSHPQNFDDRGQETIDGQTLVHLGIEMTQHIPAEQRPTVEAMMSSLPGRIPEEQRKQMEEAFSKIPDGHRVSADIWIDGESGLILRLRHSVESLRADQVIHHFQESRVFSDFNTARLPGPLPE